MVIPGYTKSPDSSLFVNSVSLGIVYIVSSDRVYLTYLLYKQRFLILILLQRTLQARKRLCSIWYCLLQKQKSKINLYGIRKYYKSSLLVQCIKLIFKSWLMTQLVINPPVCVILTWQWFPNTHTITNIQSDHSCQLVIQAIGLHKEPSLTITEFGALQQTSYNILLEKFIHKATIYIYRCYNNQLYTVCSLAVHV